MIGRLTYDAKRLPLLHLSLFFLLFFLCTSTLLLLQLLILRLQLAQLHLVFLGFCILRLAIFFIPVIPIPSPVMMSIVASINAAMHSNLSCPYWCVLSDSFPDIFTPIITIIELITSEAECIASDIIAYEDATIPDISFISDSIMFTIMLICDTFMASFSFSFIFFLLVI